MAKLNSESFKNIEAIYVIIKSGGSIISLICDNNNKPGCLWKTGWSKVYLEQLGIFIFLVFDYVHIFKNVRNNWITVGNETLSFAKDGKTYVPCLGDVPAPEQNSTIDEVDTHRNLS